MTTPSSLSADLHADDLKREPLRRQRRNRIRSKMRPRLVRRTRNARVQIKQKLIREAANRWRLPERQTHADRAFQVDSLRANGLVAEQRHKRASARMRPHIRA